MEQTIDEFAQNHSSFHIRGVVVSVVFDFLFVFVVVLVREMFRK